MAEKVRLCPHCANSITVDAAKCPYCKADIEPAVAPQWPTRAEAPAAKSTPRPARISVLSKIIPIAGLAALAAGVFLIAMPRGRSESQAMLEEKIKELQEKEQKIQTLEAEAAKTRQTLTEQSGQLSELKTKLEESQKELASVRVRLSLATREVDRLTSGRAQPAAPPSARPADPAAQPSPAPVRRAAEPGIYETIRTTQVYEDPSGSSRVLSKIVAGTRVNVVRSVGDWLEVRSKQGNPPGFVRWDDCRLVGRGD